MKDFSKATPRPWWASGESSSNGAYKIEDADGWHVAWIKEKKDVHLIVTAVNNFDKMKEAIIKANNKLAYLYGYNLGKDAVSDVPDMLDEIQQLLESLK